jgi:hypothetical protein
LSSFANPLQTSSAAAALPASPLSPATAAAAATPAASSALVLVSLSVPDCRLQFGEHLRLAGECPELGGWSVAAAPRLTFRVAGGAASWTAELALPPGEHRCLLVLVRPDGSVQWEAPGAPRVLRVPRLPPLVAPLEGPHLLATCRFGDTAATACRPVPLEPAQLKVTPCAAFG